MKTSVYTKHHQPAELGDAPQSTVSLATRTNQGPAIAGSLLLLPLLFLVVSCSNPAPFEQDLDRYTLGLSRILDQRRAVEPTQTLRPPRTLGSSGVNTEASIDLLDFLRTSPCALHALISAHNASLGKLGDRITQLVYQVQFLQLAPACIARLEASYPELASQLNAVMKRKQHALAADFRAAMLSGPEWQQFWQPRTTLHDYPSRQQSNLEATLLALINASSQLLDTSFEGGPGYLHETSQPLQSGEGGLLILAWSELAEQLSTANKIIDTFMATRPLCYRGQSNPRAEQLNGLVLNVFVQAVQPQVARLNQRTYALLPLILQLEQSLDADTDPAYRAFMTARQDRIDRAKVQLEQHVERLNHLLSSCGLAPSKPN